MKKAVIAFAIVALLAGCAHQVPVSKQEPIVAVPEQKFVKSMKK